MTTKTKLKIAQMVDIALLISSICAGAAGHLFDSSAWWVGAKLLFVAGLLVTFICYRWQARFTLMKRKNRTETGLPIH